MNVQAVDNDTIEEGSVLENLYDLSTAILHGASLEESLDQVFDSFHHWIPYDRIGYADIDVEAGIAWSRWCRSSERILLRAGYSAPLAGSSLSIVIQCQQPRILNNLPQYLERRPHSRSTKLIVAEGYQSSMTCPLFVKDVPLGFLFFTSRQLDAYNDSHVAIMKEIATHLALLLMASQHAVPQPVHQPLEVSIRHEPPRNELLVSQLKPGMVLKNAIRCGSSLLLASGSTLTQQAISRLNLLRAKGLLNSGYIHVEEPVSTK